LSVKRNGADLDAVEDHEQQGAEAVIEIALDAGAGSIGGGVSEHALPTIHEQEGLCYFVFIPAMA
jgi:hypothetical protein